MLSAFGSVGVGFPFIAGLATASVAPLLGSGLAVGSRCVGFLDRAASAACFGAGGLMMLPITSPPTRPPVIARHTVPIPTKKAVEARIVASSPAGQRVKFGDVPGCGDVPAKPPEAQPPTIRTAIGQHRDRTCDAIPTVPPLRKPPSVRRRRGGATSGTSWFDCRVLSFAFASRDHRAHGCPLGASSHSASHAPMNMGVAKCHARAKLRPLSPLTCDGPDLRRP